MSMTRNRKPGSGPSLGRHASSGRPVATRSSRPGSASSSSSGPSSKSGPRRGGAAAHSDRSGAAGRAGGSRTQRSRDDREQAAPAPRPEVLVAPVLNTRQRCQLRGIGHHLSPLVIVGKEGITDGLLEAVAAAILQHELIKVRLAESVEGDRAELAAELALRTKSALVQVLGRTLLLYRPRPRTDPRPMLSLL